MDEIPVCGLNGNKSFLHLKESNKYPWLVDFIERWDKNANNKDNCEVYFAQCDLIDGLIYTAAYKDKG
jgi:hypothetical protein